ncbi:hypothetical protein B0H11DRAFT_2239333 [Mycena galericulata]|nr:hypothetical protein B0H11DRAFT_2239333 [Mycena galericulata]
MFLALYNMRHSLVDAPVTTLTTDVVSAQGNTAIYDLGRMYIDHFICAFRITTKPAPAPSTHPSRPSMDRLEDIIMDAIQYSGSEHRSARTRALARDGYHCMASNTIDEISWEKHKAVKKLGDETGAAIHDVQTCHIYNESILQHIKPGDEGQQQARRQHAGAALGILKMFGLKDVVQRLRTIGSGDVASASGAHDLLNIISLIEILHTAFDRLKLAFEPTTDDEANTYDIVFAYAGSSWFAGVLDLPLPEPQLLALHAACVRVAHISGAAEALDDLDRERAEMLVLARDKASGKLLDMMLSPLVSAAA